MLFPNRVAGKFRHILLGIPAVCFAVFRTFDEHFLSSFFFAIYRSHSETETQITKCWEL